MTQVASVKTITCWANQSELTPYGHLHTAMPLKKGQTLKIIILLRIAKLVHLRKDNLSLMGFVLASIYLQDKENY